MRYFYHYQDDTLYPRLSHEHAELVNRKPLVIDFNQLKHKRQSAKKSAWIKKAKALMKRMENL
jgi:hypothetical protein